VVSPENERGMQWGSDIDAVEVLLKGVCSDDIIEDVLNRSSIEVLL
jgi:hypothetical protein